MNTNEIKIIGVGGAGQNVLMNIAKDTIANTDFIVCNTNIQSLAKVQLQNKIQIGIETTKGLGTGGSIERGKLSAIESKAQILQLFNPISKVAIFIAGLGGGTGTGATPVMVQVAKEKGLFTIAIVYTPFGFEGENRYKTAKEGIEELQKYADFVLVVDNNKIQKVFSNVGFKAIFEKSDRAVEQLIKVLVPSNSSNFDASDIKIIIKKLQQGQTVFFGFAEFQDKLSERNLIEEALKNALSERENIFGVRNVFVKVTYGNTKITDEEIVQIKDVIFQKAANNPNITLFVDKEASLNYTLSLAVVAS